jgi:hypothetical protein
MAQRVRSYSHSAASPNLRFTDITTGNMFCGHLCQI